HRPDAPYPRDRGHAAQRRSCGVLHARPAIGPRGPDPGLHGAARRGRERGTRGARRPLRELRVAAVAVRLEPRRARGPAPQSRRRAHLRLLRERRDLRRQDPWAQRRALAAGARARQRRPIRMSNAFVPFERKIIDPEHIDALLADLPRPLVFTNGVFDILHRGHVTYLAEARALGACLVVAINSDASVRRLGRAPDRPINPLADRLAVVAALESVQCVTWFEDDTPLSLIKRIQ